MVAASRPINSSFLRLCLDTSVQVLTSLTRPASRSGNAQRKKKAFLIGINYESSPYGKLEDAQGDVRSMKELLIDCFSFSEDDIFLLSDEVGTSEELLPNYQNIIRHLENDFVKDDDGHTDYVFVYSGHSSQREEVIAPGEKSVEEDGQEEFIVPCDALRPEENFAFESERVITDKLLKRYLVTRLGKGSRLVAFFDSCHSGTLLNLKHYRCNRSGDLLSLIQDTARLLLIEPLSFRASRSNGPGIASSATIKKSSTMNSTMGHAYYIPWKGKIFCHGFCPRLPLGEKPQVICVSACKDRQNVIEGGTILPAIIELLRKNQDPTYRELMHAARSGTEKEQKRLQDHVKGCMREKKCHWPFNYLVKFHRRCGTDQEKELRRMAELGCEPQLSSRKPLNTKGRLHLSSLAPSSEAERVAT